MFQIRVRMFLLAGLILCCARPAAAQPISPQNPFRSYNLSGVNYASQQWERDHARKQGTSTPAPQPQRILFGKSRHRRR